MASGGGIVEIDVRKQGRVHIIRMRGQLKLGDPVDELRKALDGVIAEGHTSVVASMGGVPMADSSGIGALIRYQSMFKQKGGSIKLVQPSKLVTQTLKILGLLNMFEAFDEESAAVASFPDAAAAG
jgi:anti-anti-sigma factor